MHKTIVNPSLSPAKRQRLKRREPCPLFPFRRKGSRRSPHVLPAQTFRELVHASATVRVFTAPPPFRPCARQLRSIRPSSRAANKFPSFDSTLERKPIPRLYVPGTRRRPRTGSRGYGDKARRKQETFPELASHGGSFLPSRVEIESHRLRSARHRGKRGKGRGDGNRQPEKPSASKMERLRGDGEGKVSRRTRVSLAYLRQEQRATKFRGALRRALRY